MKLTKAEKELIELIRSDSAVGVIVNRAEPGGNFVIWVVPSPHNEATATVGVGASFNDAWQTRRTVREIAKSQFEAMRLN